MYTLAQQQITIPTGPAKHDSTLTDLRLGGLNNEQIIKLGEQKELLIPGGLIVGDVTKNSVPGLKNSSVLGGGTDFGNKII
ncbi:MAG: hypothetical protein LBD11_03960 [Candidatus Peribacteria bacterium]|nr:hypothetical protein [Candidatus Peribacteria bacterium]